MDTVYVETTVIGNIAGRLHSDPVIAARQQTRETGGQSPHADAGSSRPK